MLCILHQGDDGLMSYLLLYVDDMLIAAKSKFDVQKLKNILGVEFNIEDLVATHKILGTKIHRDRDQNKLFLSQKSYIKKILCTFLMPLAKPINASSAVNAHFSLVFFS